MESGHSAGRLSLEQRRQQLLDAAVEVMSARGISGATTRAITEAAGVPQSVFHYCFDSKSALLKMLLECENERAMALAWRADPVSDSFSEALEAAITAQVHRVVDEPAHFLVLAELNVLARTDDQMRSLAQADRIRAITQIAEVLDQWHPAKSTQEKRTWAQVVLAGIAGLTEGWLTDRDSHALYAAAQKLAAAIVAGMTPRSVTDSAHPRG